MNLTRKTLPSSESQNPSTCHLFLPSAVSKYPPNLASTKGFRACGQEMLAATSKKSYASILSADFEKEICEESADLQAPTREQMHNKTKKHNIGSGAAPEPQNHGSEYARFPLTASKPQRGSYFFAFRRFVGIRHSRCWRVPARSPASR